MSASLQSSQQTLYIAILEFGLPPLAAPAASPPGKLTPSTCLPPAVEEDHLHRIQPCRSVLQSTSWLPIELFSFLAYSLPPTGNWWHAFIVEALRFRPNTCGLIQHPSSC